MTTHLHVLKGCSPVPLANYLKALGILRLVGEQADPHARGWWQDEAFCLLTRMSEEELEVFFLERYEPTPLLSPWNKGCGFFKKDDPGLCPLERSQAKRFERFRQGIKEARRLLDEIAEADAVIRAIKARTKTNKAFQSEEQRQLLANSTVYRGIVDQLRAELAKPGLLATNWAALEQELSTVRSVVTPAVKPPSKAEATALKSSRGFKRLQAAADRPFKSLKATLIPDCRLSWRGPHADWLSTAVVLDENGEPHWPSLLGTGGNDGNLDFTNNYMQQLGVLFDLVSPNGAARPQARDLLQHALWMDAVNNLLPSSIGQYQPGSAGGANSSIGFASGNLINPWDFVLMMEGTLLFRCAATRRGPGSAAS